MKSGQWIDQHLELVSDLKTNPESTQQKASFWLSKVWSFIVNGLIKRPGLKIRTVCDRNGTTWWYVYDPATDRAVWLDSESEVRIWIEKNH